MFNIFNKNPKGYTITFKIDGMHCNSCAMNIDGELEDLKGVISANTSYAKSTTSVEYDPQLVDKKALIKTINSTGYKAKQIK